MILYFKFTKTQSYMLYKVHAMQSQQRE